MCGSASVFWHLFEHTKQIATKLCQIYAALSLVTKFVATTMRDNWRDQYI